MISAVRNEAMKGTIPKCLEEMVCAHHGRDAWKQVQTLAGLATWHTFLTTEDVDDADVLRLFSAAAKVLGRSEQGVMDDYGMHWGTVYAPDIYGVFYKRVSSAREMLLSMSEVHRVTTRRTPNAAPPHFEFRWLDQDTLVMTYRSKRALAALMPGLIRGVGAYFHESLEVVREGDEMTIRFPSLSAFEQTARV